LIPELPPSSPAGGRNSDPSSFRDLLTAIKNGEHPLGRNCHVLALLFVPDTAEFVYFVDGPRARPCLAVDPVWPRRRNVRRGASLSGLDAGRGEFLGRSRTTFENAAFSADILRRAGVPSALLITHCRDMARALWSFHAVGYPVIPAICSAQQTEQRRSDEASSLSVSSFSPQVPSLLVSYLALHELIGLGWYRYRYRDGDVRPSAGLAAGVSR